MTTAPAWFAAATRPAEPVETRPLLALAKDFSDEKARKNHETGTRYLSDIERFLEWCAVFGIDPENLERHQVNAWLTYLHSDHWDGHPGACVTDCTQLKKKPYSLVAIKRRLAPINGFLEYCVSVKRLPSNAAKGLSVDPPETDGLDTLTPAECSHVWDCATNFHHNILDSRKRANVRNGALVALLLGAGLRREEAAKARAEGLGTDHQGRPTLTFVRKGGDTQTIPLSLPVHRAILAQLDGRTTGPILTADRKRRNDAGELEHTALSLRGIGHVISEIGAYSGVRGRSLHPHLLRETAITLALTLPETAPYQVMTYFGHKHFKTTIGYDAFSKVTFKDIAENPLQPREFWLAA